MRDEIVPINKKYPISNLINSCNNYLKNYDGKRSITIEYILIDGINDSEELARKLAKLLSNISCKINLIPFNPFEGSNYKRSKTKTIENFKKILMDKGFITTLRVTRGDAIDGACGQLVGKLNKSIKGKKAYISQTYIMTENFKSARSAKIGKVFKVARKELGLSKVEVSNAAFMNIRYINAIESGDYSVFPSEVFAKAYFTKYQDFLSIECEFPPIYESNNRQDKIIKKSIAKINPSLIPIIRIVGVIVFNNSVVV